MNAPNFLKNLRLGLAGKLALFTGIMLFALTSVILAIVFKQQSTALSESAEREVKRFLSPVETLTLEIDQTVENLIRLEELRIRIDRHERRNRGQQTTYYNRFFDEDHIKLAEKEFRERIRPSQRSESLDEKRFEYLQRRARWFAYNPARTPAYAKNRRSFEQDLRRYFDYENRVELALTGVDLEKFRAQSVDVFRWPRFDTAFRLTVKERSRSELNQLEWGETGELRLAMDDLHTPYKAKKPRVDSRYRTFSTDMSGYFLISRTLFRNPDIARRAALVKNALDDGSWRRYAVRERPILARLAEIGAALAERREELSAEDPPVPPLRDEGMRDLYEEYAEVLEERGALVDDLRMDLFRKTRPAYASKLEELNDLRTQLKATNRREDPDAYEQLATRIGEVKQEIEERFESDQELSEVERIADAFEHLRDAALYNFALLEYRPDQDSYDQYVKFENERRTANYRWANLREWALRPVSETRINQRRVGWAMLTRTRTETEEEMVRLDTTPIAVVTNELLYGNTAAFTRILVDQSDVLQRIREERGRFLDVALSIGLRILLAAIMLSVLLTGTIKRIIAGADRVGQGDLNVRFEYSGRDEIGNLTDSLNTMVRGLKEREELRGELQAAEEIQKRLIPEGPPANFTDRLSFGMFYKAMNGVGGDYFDFIDAGRNRFVFCIADVSNHGVGPAIVMTLMRSQLHAVVRRGELDPVKMILDLNERQYADTPENIFITMFLGVYDAGTGLIRYVSAGHNLAYIFRFREESLETVPGGGMPVGAVPNDMFGGIVKVQEVTLKTGDLFFQFTDGVNEAMDANDRQFENERLEKILSTLGKKKPQLIVTTIAQAVERFSGKRIFCDGPSELNDDIAMIAFRRKG